MANARVEAWWVDLDSMETYEIGAMLLALLAFPEEAETPKFEGVHRSICARAVRQRAERDDAYSGSVQRLRPLHMTRPEANVQKDLRTFGRRVRDRMLAGRLCNIKLTALSGRTLDLPGGVTNLSINGLIGLALDDLDSVDIGNVTERVWRESRPVVHLAAAIQAFLASRPQNQRPRALGDIIFEPDAIRWVTRLTIDNEQLIRTNQTPLDMAIVAEKLIPIRFGHVDRKN